MNLNFTEVHKNLQYLVLKLKKGCDSNGLEINPCESAKIIHKIGLEHLKLSPDKVSLIKSVGLLNSALAREPSNASDIENDLSNACQHILQQANASCQTVDLVQHAKHVIPQIESMRAKTNQALSEIQLIKTGYKKTNSKSEQEITIKLIKNIQQQITTDYKQIMIKLCQYCVDVMGPPPCKFAVVGMGSLARKEITPYSDFEHMILLENLANYKIHLEYFRWFSVIFHTIILNLQESIIPSLNVKYLNDNTCDLNDWFFDTYTSGVSFDGMMPHACKFPLGRAQPTEKKPWTTELIKPVNKMLEYLGSEENLKNGYHLRDILTETCFVYGEQTLHDQFLSGYQSYKNCKTSEAIRDELRKQVKEDLEKFATRLRLINLKPTKPLNIKQLFYRTSTLFIAALGKIFSINSSSCFDIINELAEQRKITNNAKQKLSFAVAIACKIRLGIYMKEKSQTDYIQPCSDAVTIFDSILDVTDVDSIVCYFQTTYCLQLEVIRLLGIERNHFYSNVKMLNIAICYSLKLDHLMLALSEDIVKERVIWFAESIFFDDYKKHFENDCDSSVASSDSSDSNSITFQRYENLCSIDKHSKIGLKFSLFDKSIQNLEKRLSNVSKFFSSSDAKQLIKEEDFKKLLSHILHRIFALQHHDCEEALEFWERYFDILQRWFKKENIQILYQIRGSAKKSNAVFFIFGLIPSFSACCLVDLNRLDDAVVHLNQLDAQPFFQKREANKFHNVIESFTENPDTDVNTEFVILKYLIDGGIWFKMKKFEKSLNHLQISLGLLLSLKQNYHFSFFLNCAGKIFTWNGVYFNVIGSCLMEMKEYEHALVYFKQAAKEVAHEDFFDDEDSDDEEIGRNDVKFETYLLPETFQVSALFLNLCNCLVKLEKFDEVFKYVTITLLLSIYWKLELKTRAKIFYVFGLFYKTQYYFEEAVAYFQNSLSIYQELKTEKEISSTFSELLHCHMQMYQRERSEKGMKDMYQSEKFVANVAIIPTSSFGENDALLFHFKIGHVFLKMKHYKKALEFFKISLGIAMSRELLENETHIIILYNSIGTCLINLSKYEESLIYFNFAKEKLEKYNNTETLEIEMFHNLQIIANSFHSVGKCFLKFDQFKKALSNLEVALEVVPYDFDKEELIYLSTISVSHLKMFREQQSVLSDIGFCHMQQNEYEIAQTFFQKFLLIYNKLPKADEAIVVATRLRLLTCHMEMYQRKRVEKHLKDLRACNSIETTIRMVDIQTFTYSIQL